MLCPCHSKKLYEACCKPLHDGKPADNACALMRSRYSAYAMGKAPYIVSTTCPTNPLFRQQPLERIAGILQFCQETSFDGLEIIECADGEQVSFVTFKATLHQGGQDASFTEKSRFKKISGPWLYVSGEFPGRQ